MFKHMITIIMGIIKNHKEEYMNSIEAMSIKPNKYMGMGVFAVTHNKVDIFTIIMGIIMVVCYLMYTHIRTMREAKRMDWSPTRTYLRAMTKEYNRYYR